MSPACDVAIGIWLKMLLPAGKADWPYVACLVDVFVKFDNADIIIHHGSVIAGVQNDSLHHAGLHEG